MKKHLIAPALFFIFLFAGFAANAQVAKQKQNELWGRVAALSSDSSVLTLSSLKGKLPKEGQTIQLDQVMLGCGIAESLLADVKVERIASDSEMTVRIIKHLQDENDKWMGPLGEKELVRLHWEGSAGKEVGEKRSIWGF